MKKPKPKNPHAAALGRLARGVPKDYSDEERQRRADQMRENGKKRWAKKGKE